MSFLFNFSAITLLAMMVLVYVLVSRDHSKLSQVLKRLLLCSSLTISFYILSTFTTDLFFAKVLYSIYFCGLDFSLIFLLQLTYYIVESSQNSFNKISLLKSTLIACSFLDSFVILAYISSDFVFTLNLYYSPFLNINYWTIKYNYSYLLHIFTCYTLVALIIRKLILKIIKSSSFIKQRYCLILIGFSLLMIVHTLIYVTDFIYDFAILLFPFLVFTTYYFSFISIPKRVISIILRQASNSMNSIFLCFDNMNNTIFINKKAKNIFFKYKNFKKELEELHCKWLNASDENDDYLKQTKIFYSIDQNIIFSCEHHKIKDKSNRLSGSYLKLDERTEEINKLNQERFISTHDELTGLLNRTEFFNEAAILIDKTPETQRYLIATDIKDFKLVNELFGANFADEILRLESSKLNNTLFLAGRISSDKFAILVDKDKFNHETFASMINEIQSMTKNLNYKLILYAGIYEIANPYESVQSMYDKATLAIKKIYGTYDNNISYYDTLIMENLLHQKNVITDFSKAIENNEFVMYLQPQISAKTGECLGAEALVRWNHPKRGMLSPNRFVDVLENGGLIYKMDKQIWEQAAKKLREWKDQGIEHYISVNISAKDFFYADLYDEFTKIVNKYGISPGKMNLEITETLLMQDEKLHKNILNKLRDFGFKIEMDDFGSGYSSLNSLKSFEMDVLKIDMEFLSQTTNSHRSTNILGSIISMAKELNMSVITEGVETEEHIQLLKNLGSDLFQGYYFSKPVPVKEFEEKYLNFKRED